MPDKLPLDALEDFGEAATFLFIDGPHLYTLTRSLGFEVDYLRFRTAIKDVYHLMRAYYYTPIQGSEEFSAVKPLADWLEYHGFTVVTRQQKIVSDKSRQDRRVHTPMDALIAADLNEIMQRGNHAIIVSGSEELVPCVQSLKRRGVIVSLISSLGAQATTNDALRRASDQFIELNSLKEDIIRQTEQAGQLQPVQRVSNG